MVLLLEREILTGRKVRSGLPVIITLVNQSEQNKLLEAVSVCMTPYTVCAFPIIELLFL